MASTVDVILQAPVRGLGAIGDKVRVRRGYARNFLLPQAWALPVTPDNLALFESRRAELEAKADAQRVEAERLSQAMGDLTLVVHVKTTYEGKMFGSVTPREVLAQVEAAGYNIDRKAVRMPTGHIHHTGEYEVELHLHPLCMKTVALWVVPEGVDPSTWVHEHREGSNERVEAHEPTEEDAVSEPHAEASVDSATATEEPS